MFFSYLTKRQKGFTIKAKPGKAHFTDKKEGRLMMNKPLVAYFSASGVTARLADKLAAVTGAHSYAIQPETPYTTEDLDWTNKQSRSTIEMNDRTFRPPVAGKLAEMEQYDVIFLGFPIWWGVAPTVVNTFLEQYDLSGKTIVPFATSGSSGMGNTNAELAPSCPGADLKAGKRFAASASEGELKDWVDRLGL